MSTEDLQALLQQLAAISPMPDDTALLENEENAELVDRYYELIQSIGKAIGDDAPTCAIEALVSSFGLGDGFEVYWSTLHLIERFPGDATYKIVREHLEVGTPGIRQWCCIILGRRRDPEDLPLFLAHLSDSEPNVVVESLQAIRMLAQKWNVTTALGSVQALLSSSTKSIARAALDAQREIQETATTDGKH